MSAEAVLADVKEQCEFILAQGVGLEARAVCNCVLDIIAAEVD